RDDSGKLSREVELQRRSARWPVSQFPPTIGTLTDRFHSGFCMIRIFAFLLLLPLPEAAFAADITGVPRIREGDVVQIGSTRIRLGGIDAPSTDQLCLSASGERWTCGVAARAELIKHAGNKSWTCHARSTDRRGRTVARCDVDGEDIQKWLVTSGW